jgi:hypothetical protein
MSNIDDYILCSYFIVAMRVSSIQVTTPIDKHLLINSQIMGIKYRIYRFYDKAILQ